MNPILNTKSGQSLIQSLLAIAIATITISAIITVTVSMQKSNKQLTQKLEAVELKNQLVATFMNPANCTCQLNPNINTIDAAQLNFNSGDSSSLMNLNELKASCGASAPSLVKVGELLPGTQTSLKVKSVSLSEIQATGNPEEFLAYYKIEFEPSTVVGALAPLKIKQSFYTDPASPPGAKTILTCQNDATGVRVASGNGVVGTNNSGNVTIDLALQGFDPAGKDPHIIVSQRDYNFDEVEGNTMDASYCGFVRDSKLVFTVTCWASTNSSDATVRSSFDWIAIQK